MFSLVPETAPQIEEFPVEESQEVYLKAETSMILQRHACGYVCALIHETYQGKLSMFSKEIMKALKIIPRLIC